MKYLLAIIVLLITLSAQAVTLGVETGVQKDQITHQVSPYNIVNVQEGKLGIHATYAVINRVEADYLFAYELPNFAVGVRTGLGQTASIDSHTTFSIEPVIAFNPITNFKLSGGFMYRNDFTRAIRDQSHIVSLGATYKLTPAFDVGVRYFDQRGDQKLKTTLLTAAYTF